MSLIGARVNRNTIGTVGNTDLGVLDHIRIIALARISDQGDFVEVNT